MGYWAILARAGYTPRRTRPNYASELARFGGTYGGKVSPAPDVHLIGDNCAPRHYPRVRAWLARRPRFHSHFTPTHSSWLNQLERWFVLITNQSIRLGSLVSLTELEHQIYANVDHQDPHPNPFMWTTTADSILGKLERLIAVLTETQHSVLLRVPADSRRPRIRWFVICSL